MKLKSLVFIAITATAASAQSPAPAPAAAPAPKRAAAPRAASPVDSVIQLVKGGMSDDLIIRSLIRRQPAGARRRPRPSSKRECR